MCNLSGLLLVSVHLFCHVVVESFCITIHFFDSLTHGFLFFLGFGQLNLDIAQTLLELVDLSLSHTELLNYLGGAHHVSGLNHTYMRWELRLLKTFRKLI